MVWKVTRDAAGRKERDNGICNVPGYVWDHAGERLLPHIAITPTAAEPHNLVRTAIKFCELICEYVFFFAFNAREVAVEPDWVSAERIGIFPIDSVRKSGVHKVVVFLSTAFRFLSY